MTPTESAPRISDLHMIKEANKGTTAIALLWQLVYKFS